MTQPGNHAAGFEDPHPARVSQPQKSAYAHFPPWGAPSRAPLSYALPPAHLRCSPTIVRQPPRSLMGFSAHGRGGSPPATFPLLLFSPRFIFLCPPAAPRRCDPNITGQVSKTFATCRFLERESVPSSVPPPSRTPPAFNFFKTAPRCPKLRSKMIAQFPETSMMPGSHRRRWPPPTAILFPDTSFTSRYFLPRCLTPHTLQPIAHGASYLSI